MKSGPGFRPQFQAIRAVSVLALGLLLNLTWYADAGVAQHATRDQQPIERLLRRYERVRVDPADLVRTVRTTGRLVFPTRDQTFDVELKVHDLRAPGYRAEAELPGGGRQLLPPRQPRTYRGTASQFPGSEARFSIKDGSLEGVILTPAEWYFLEPLRNFSPSADPSEMVVYRRSDIRFNVLGECGGALAHRVGGALQMAEPRILAGTSEMSTAMVATEADYEYAAASGGAAEANATIMDVLNLVDGIYRSQLSLSVQVVYQHVWSAAGDPYASTTPATMLPEFQSYWNANFTAVPFDLAHMWTGRDMDGSTVGIAYLSVVCGARSYSYGISQRFNSAPGKYILTAHEIGHNFGATHPDQATPPQTDCSNTIMNSSVGTGTTFCQFSRSEISSYVASHSSCLALVPASPTNLRIPR